MLSQLDDLFNIAFLLTHKHKQVNFLPLLFITTLGGQIIKLLSNYLYLTIPFSLSLSLSPVFLILMEQPSRVLENRGVLNSNWLIMCSLLNSNRLNTNKMAVKQLSTRKKTCRKYKYLAYLSIYSYI